MKMLSCKNTELSPSLDGKQSVGSQDLVVKLGNDVATKGVEGDVNLKMVGEYGVL
jgi:hypothetical protein